MKKLSIFTLVIMLLVACVILPGCDDKENTEIEIPELKAYVDGYEYAEASEDFYGHVGKIPLKNYELICCYSAVVEEFMTAQTDYDADMTVEEKIEYRKALLDGIDAETGKTNREILQDKALEQHKKFAVLFIRSGHKDLDIGPAKAEEISDQWKSYGVQYLEALEGIYEDVDSPDDAMKLMIGSNVMETVAYMQAQASASNMVSKEFDDMEFTNEDVEKYYNEHIDEYRIVQVRAVYFKDRAEAEAVSKLMSKRPEDIDNLAKAYNESNMLAETNGLINVTSTSVGVAQEIKDWALKQNNDSLFENHGDIELLETSRGWYLVMCNNIFEYSDEEGNEVYKSVAQGYKGSLLEDIIEDLLAKEDYTLSVDTEKAKSVLDEVF